MIVRWGHDGLWWYVYFVAVLAGIVGITIALTPLNPRVLCACSAWIRLVDVTLYTVIAIKYAGRRHLFGRNLALVHFASLCGFCVASARDTKEWAKIAMLLNVLLHYCHVPIIALLQCVCIQPSPWIVPINMARFTQSFR